MQDKSEVKVFGMSEGPNVFDFAEVMFDSLPRIDANKDELLTREEFSSFLKRSDIRENERRSANFALTHFDDIKGMAENDDLHHKLTGRAAQFRHFELLQDWIWPDGRTKDSISKSDLGVVQFLGTTGGVELQHSLVRGRESELGKESARNAVIGAGLATVFELVGMGLMKPFPITGWTLRITGGLIGLGPLLEAKNAYDAFTHKGSDQLVNEFQERKKMIDSWGWKGFP